MRLWKTGKALLIGESATEAKQISEILRNLPGQPLELEHATSLAEGLERLSDDAFGLLLLDMGLPSMSRETLLRIKNLSKDMAVIVLTAQDDKALVAEALQLGAQEYLAKTDIQVGSLTRVVFSATERQQIEKAKREQTLDEDKVRQRERDRMAMDLHDGVIQEIYGVSLSLEVALHDVQIGEPGRLGMEKAIDSLHDIIRDIRSYIFDLKTEPVKDLGQALRALARDFSLASQIETVANILGELPLLTDLEAAALFQIVREALSNARRHAQATSVSIELTPSHGMVRLAVRDDGRGFDSLQDIPLQSQGVRNMSTRAKAIGAQFSIQTTIGVGTAVIVELPLEEQSMSAAA